MYITDDILYLRLQKTGSSHVVNALEKACHGSQEGEMHGRASQELLESGRIIAGSVRNPWDWYVSIWAYGCGGKGILYDRLAGKRRIRGYGYRRSPARAARELLHETVRKRGVWRRLYRDASSPENFRKWLKMLFGPAGTRASDEKFHRSSLSDFAGLYTYRYCHLFHRNTEHLYDGSLENTTQLEEKDLEENIVQKMLRTEDLSRGILQLLKMAGVELADEVRRSITGMGRTNPSDRKRKTSYYYDSETAELVNSRDSMLVRKYGYEPPEI
ncbi:MAG: hypothetical protein GF388_05940 [Candidatus Aegiribacteria sp.]|nr:hypothetical protein [Candidatus Aegiribacteria sp.]MBD3294722.1 hypothetical protein [Candidatus Fermentibacteria bacterium]